MPSKAIRTFAYDVARNELTVTFVRGPTYVYSLVPAALAEAFAASKAKGVFHNAQLRDRYPFRKARSLAASSGELRELLEASVEADGAATPASDHSALQSDGSRGRG